MLARLEQNLLRISGFKPYIGPRISRWKRNYFITLDRLGLLKPWYFVQWLSTYSCNLACPFCEASAGQARSDELCGDEIKRLIIDEMVRMKCNRLLISGGEPLMRADLMDIMDYANRRHIRLGLVSNGYRVEEYWEDLKKMTYFQYFTSLDGPEELHNQIRGKQDAYQKMIRGLERFTQIGVPSRLINTVVFPGNLRFLPDMLKIIKDLSISLWILTPVSRVGRAESGQSFSLNREEIQELLAFIRSHHHEIQIDLAESHSYLWSSEKIQSMRPFFCRAGLTRCSIMPAGEVLPCHQVYDLRYSEGNIREVPLSVIWKKGFRNLRHQPHRTVCDGCAFLPTCQTGCWAEMEKQGNCLKNELSL